MLYGFLLTAFIFMATVMLLLILIQQTKGSMGLGALGGGTQMLFGGSGGQNFFQKVTWFLAASFMILSLLLSIMKSSQLQTRYLIRTGKREIIHPVQKPKSLKPTSLKEEAPSTKSPSEPASPKKTESKKSNSKK